MKTPLVVSVIGALLAWPSGKQDTGLFRTTLQADGIAVIPADVGPIAAGTQVDVQVLRGLETEEA